MEKLKKTIIILSIIIVIILIILLVFIIKETRNNEEDNKHNEISNFVEAVSENNVLNLSTFKTVENCVQYYYDSILNNYSDYEQYSEEGNEEETISIKEYEEELKERKLNLLSEKYKKENNINRNNINDYIKTIGEKVIVIGLDMKVVTNGTIEKYAIHGITMDLDYKFLNEFYMFVNLDVNTGAFSIEPIDEKINNIDDIKIENDNKTIELNDYNEFEIQGFDYEESASEYLSRYKKLALASLENSYNYLNKEYREKRFGNIEKYKEFVQSNYDRIQEANLTKYKVNEYEDYNEYICLDQNEFYYIFRENKNEFNYDVMLDIYTINLQETKNRYDNENEQVKVGMNIEKVFTALKSKDYNYVYNKLDDTFKKNNYENIERFEEYIKQNLFEDNKVEYLDFSEQGKAYIYKLNISSSDEENEEVKNMTVIMELLDNYEFKMSFSLEE